MVRGDMVDPTEKEMTAEDEMTTGMATGPADGLCSGGDSPSHVAAAG
jgi:hypothetical protein